MKSLKANKFLTDLIYQLQCKTWERSPNGNLYGRCEYSVFTKTDKYMSVYFEFVNNMRVYFTISAIKEQGKRNRKFFFLLEDQQYWDREEKEWIEFSKVNLNNISVEQAVNDIMYVFDRNLRKE